MTAIQKLLKTAISMIGSDPEADPSGKEMPWSKLFINQCFAEAFGEKTAELLLCDYSEPQFDQSVRSYQQKDLYFNTPRIGDLVFFSGSGQVTHAGMIYDLYAERIYAVEGSSASQAGEFNPGILKTEYLRSDSKIDGYARPDWKMLPATGASAYDRQMILNFKNTYYNPGLPKIAEVWTEEVIEV